jgi:hypothetical protein
VKLNHTPWKVRGRAGYAGHAVVDANGRPVCALPSNSKRPTEERDGMASLLASAPTMAQLLTTLTDRNASIDAFRDALAEARTLLAQLEGR